MHLLNEQFVSFFLGDNRGFLKEGVDAYQGAPMSPLNSPTFFSLQKFTSIVYAWIWLYST
jgi:hypothetical protein